MSTLPASPPIALLAILPLALSSPSFFSFRQAAVIPSAATPQVSSFAQPATAASVFWSSLDLVPPFS